MKESKKKSCKQCEWNTDWCYCTLGFSVLDIVRRFLGQEAYDKLLGDKLFSRNLNKNKDCDYYRRKRFLF